MPTRFVDLPAYLTSLLESPSISANGLRQLHRSLEETWERVSVDSFLAGHPYWRDKHSTPESMFLHELGHVLNVRLTGDLTLAPPAFLEFGEPFFPGLSDRHRSVSGELFAHCFAMGVFSRHPELRELDPFTMVNVEDKQAFGQFMEALIRTLPE